MWLKLDNLGFHREISIRLLVCKRPIKPEDTTGNDTDAGYKGTNHQDNEIPWQGVHLLTSESVVVIE